jgi:hypothetical protein
MKFDWNNIDWLSMKPSKERAVIGMALLIVGGLLFQLFSGSGASSGLAAPAMAKDMMRPAAMISLVPLEPVQSGNCQTAAPRGWHVTDQNQQGTVFSLASGDGAQVASYAGAAIGSGQVQGYYGPQYRTPETFALFAVGTVTGEQAQMTGAERAIGPYRAIQFTTGRRSGWVILYVFPVSDPGGYGVIMRIAAGREGDRHSVGVAGAAAAAIRCRSIVVPSNLPVYHAPSDPSHGASRACKGCSDSNLAGTYNAQLGTGWVHDDEGNIFNVDTSSDYHATGPDGPGYYAQSGNSWKKLEPGLE